ncbi:hypothetical protein OZX72_04655 [Bifidobacterium sp. ESL0769]|uniref:hypothetical protein n=1 Tax=Bifidobacterium sp. ESL0769 TaxID=2983229 RepID=UPI0023F87224|nr:hypothetical protein [Bifidobacterium sp. ESL0769]WEV68270.1 hypothetical protein OZX72_04655 [Bifidobacterium sp. ESL0769]
MKERIAWGDESIRTQDTRPSRYVIGVSICNLEESTVRLKFREAKLLTGRKVHWHDMTPNEHRRSVSLINSLKLQHITVSAEPLLDTMRPERARRKCLETLLPILENQFGITRLFMESRSAKQNKEELEFIRVLHSKLFVRKLRYELLPGDKDSRLWIPDQILGASEATEREMFTITDLQRFTINL